MLSAIPLPDRNITEETETSSQPMKKKKKRKDQQVEQQQQEGAEDDEVTRKDNLLEKKKKKKKDRDNDNDAEVRSILEDIQEEEGSIDFKKERNQKKSKNEKSLYGEEFQLETDQVTNNNMMMTRKKNFNSQDNQKSFDDRFPQNKFRHPNNRVEDKFRDRENRYGNNRFRDQDNEKFGDKSRYRNNKYEDRDDRDFNSYGDRFKQNKYGDKSGDRFQENRYGDSFRDNKYGGSFRDNKYGGSFRDNKYGDSFRDNKYGDSFRDNKYGDNFRDNKYGDNFRDNKYGDNFRDNKYGDRFRDNKYEDSFRDNKYGDSFRDNKYGDSFKDNKYGDSFRDNKYGDRFRDNKYGDIFRDNKYGDSFRDNKYGGSFRDNKYGGSFRENKYGDNFRENKYGDNLRDNKYGDKFRDNKYGDKFRDNKYGDKFRDNKYGDKFQQDTSGENRFENKKRDKLESKSSDNADYISSNEDFVVEKHTNQNLESKSTSPQTPQQKEEPKGEYIYGIEPVYAALKSGKRKFHALFIHKPKPQHDKSRKLNRLKIRKIIEAAQLVGVTIEMTTRAKLNSFVENSSHQGVVLDAEPLKLPLLDQLEEASSPEIVALLVSVSDPQNVGAIMRSCHWFGITRVVLSLDNSSSPTATVAKTSAGALDLLNVHGVTSVTSFLTNSKEKGWRVIGTVSPEANDSSPTLIDAASPETPEANEPSPTLNCLDSFNIDQSFEQKPSILVLGEQQLRKSVDQLCDIHIRVPGAPTLNNNPIQNVGQLEDNDSKWMNSLNVSVATGIILHQLVGSIQKKQ